LTDVCVRKLAPQVVSLAMLFMLPVNVAAQLAPSAGFAASVFLATIATVVEIFPPVPSEVPVLPRALPANVTLVRVTVPDRLRRPPPLPLAPDGLPSISPLFPATFAAIVLLAMVAIAVEFTNIPPPLPPAPPAVIPLPPEPAVFPLTVLRTSVRLAVPVR
jgi:hypothetical protein